jgi:hypothetical protein
LERLGVKGYTPVVFAKSAQGREKKRVELLFDVKKCDKSAQAIDFVDSSFAKGMKATRSERRWRAELR